jgi:hypothetical protein
MTIQDIITTYGTNADFMDISTGITYHIQDYFRAKKLGLPTEGIFVSQGGAMIGHIPESELQDLKY